MSSRSLEHLYAHLPAFMRRDDAALFLKRFLSPPCAEADAVDEAFDAFHLQIAPETASEEFINWFLWSLFGWGYFPEWFTLGQRRAFYSKVARLYAMRGTARGIEEFLAAFGISSRVVVQGAAVGEMAVGEDEWLLTEPLAVVVQIFPNAAAVAEDLDAVGEWAAGESHAAVPSQSLARPDLDQLLRFQWPLGHVVFIEDRTLTP